MRRDTKLLFQDLVEILNDVSMPKELEFVVSARPEDYISEMGAVPTNSSSSDPEPAFILIQDKLGIAFWCIPLLFGYAQSMFNHALSNEQVNVDTRMQSSLILLAVNADNHSAWNMRKTCLMNMLCLNDVSDQQFHSVSHKELDLLDLLLSKHPKSGETWAHRRWLLLLRGFGKRKDVKVHVGREMEVCENSAKLYPNNYYAWTHRSWVLERMEGSREMLEQELCKAREWVSCHVSQYCGFSYLQQVLMKIVEAEGNDDHLFQERKETRELLVRYPGHESVWMHYRFLWDMISSRRKRSELVSMMEEEMRDVQRVEDESVGELSRKEEQQRHALTYRLWICKTTAKLIGHENKISRERVLQHNSRICNALIQAAPMQKECWSHLCTSLE